MTFTATTWLLSTDTTKGSERLVMISLANHAGEDGCAWPSHATIAREANLSVATVKRTLSALVERGILTRSVNAAPDDRIPRDRRPNLYCLVGFVHNHDATGGTTTTPRQTRRGAQPRRDGGHNHDATGGTVSAPKQSLEQSGEQSIENQGAEPLVLVAESTVENPRPFSLELARAITKDYWDRANPKPMQKFFVILQVVEDALRAGWPEDTIRAALPMCGTVSRGWLESQMRKFAGTQAKPQVDTDRDAPSGRIRM